MRRLSGICTRLLLLYFWALLIGAHTTTAFPDIDSEISATPGLPTVTVRGFLNFKTTVDGTVIVFTPASELPAAQPNTKEPIKPTKNDPSVFSTNAILHSNALDSRDAVPVDIQDIAYTQPPTLLDPIKSDVGDLAHLGHRVKEPFLQHISDNAVLPSTVQTNNDLETETIKRVPQAQNQYPTGLVTVLDGTHVESGSTTIFETKVIGTYIDGKYAQILQSTSKIIVPTTIHTPSYKTVTSAVKQTEEVTSKHILEQPTASSEIKPSPSSKSFLSTVSEASEISPTIKSYSSHAVSLTSDVVTSKARTSHTISSATVKSSITENFMTKSVVLQSSFQTPEITTKKIARPTQILDSVKTSNYVKTFSSVLPLTSRATRHSDEDNTVLHSSRNLRTSSTRIRFIAPRRPSQTVRLNRFKVKLTLRQDSPDGFDLTPPPDEEELDEESSSVKEEEEDDTQLFETAIIGVDPARVVFRETTITSEVTLHVGRRKSVRTLTITTSVPLKVHPTESHDFIMASEITDMSPDQDVEENFPATQSVVSRTFTTTERTLKTSLVPVFDGRVTTYHTVTESFFIMKIITAYRTLPPGDVTVLSSHTEEEEIPEVVATTLDVAANVQPSVVQSPPPQEQQTTLVTSSPEAIVQPSIPIPAVPVNSNTQITNPLLSFGQALSNNPLAAVYLGLQQLNAQITLYNTITQTSTYVATDTIYSTKTIRFYDGRSTRFRTISDPISTKKHTVTTTITSVQPYINTQAYQQQQQLQKLIGGTQLSPLQPQFSTVTTIYTTTTSATSLSTRIYTLIYNGFSTKFRTVTSTTLYPTTVTITSTKEIPLVATQPPVPFAYPYPA